MLWIVASILINLNYYHLKFCDVAQFSYPNWKQWDAITYPCLYTFRPRQDGRYFADDVVKCIFLNENMWISLKILLKFVPKGPIKNIPTLIQIMAWRRLSQPRMVSLQTHICVTRPQWVNLSWTKIHVCERMNAHIIVYDWTWWKSPEKIPGPSPFCLSVSRWR